MKRLLNKLRAIWAIITHKSWMVAVADNNVTLIRLDMDIRELVDVNEHLNSTIKNELEAFNAVESAKQLANGNTD